MRIILKWLGILLGGLVGLVAVALAVVYIASNARINTTYDVEAVVQVPTDAAALTAGEHLAVTRGCTDCHLENLGGGVFADDPMLGTLYASNLTSGAGGVGAYTDEDWVRAIRHGIGPDDKPLLWMPSHEFYVLSDEDLGALIGYLKTVPAMDNELPDHTLRPVGRALFLAGQLPLLPAELIDHNAPRPTAPLAGVTTEYGEYLAAGCIGCHGPGYSGGPIPGGPPDWLPAANLTPGGDLVNWTEAEFIAAFRTGIKPNGQPFDVNMPYKAVGQMTDDELKAVFLFLNSLPAKETGNR
jgi:mono/diheme cytochrome c family protein